MSEIEAARLETAPLIPTVPTRPLWQQAVGKLDGLVGKTARDGMLALFDQGIASGTRFFVTLMLGRLGGPEQLGVYSLGFTFIMLLICCQEALLAMPYTILGNRLRGAARSGLAGSVLIHFVVLASVAVVGLVGLGIALSVAGVLPELVPVLYVVAGALPLILLLELARRFAYAHFKVAQAVLLDTAVALALIGSLSGLAWSGRLSATSAYAVMGLICGTVGAVWLVLERRVFLVRPARVFHDFRRNWVSGRWILAGQLTLVVRGNILHWLLALVLSTAVTGVFFACETLVLLANPLLMGVANVLVPGAARAFAQGGASAVRRVVHRATLLLGALTTILAVLFIVLGNRFLGLVYGDDFSGHQALITLLALATLAEALGTASYNGLWAIERSGAGFAASLLGLAVMVGVAAVAIPLWGICGSAWGLFLGKTVASLFQYLAFRKYVRHMAREGSPT